MGGDMAQLKSIPSFPRKKNKKKKKQKRIQEMQEIPLKSPSPYSPAEFNVMHLKADDRV